MKAQGYTRETLRSLDIHDRGFPQFRAGDTIKIGLRIVEGSKERIQYFEGDVIAIKNAGLATTFTVRRIGAHGVAVERIFPYYSPKIESITYLREGDVCRAKLYYIRDRIGKRARVQEKRRTKEEKQHIVDTQE